MTDGKTPNNKHPTRRCVYCIWRGGRQNNNSKNEKAMCEQTRRSQLDPTGFHHFVDALLGDPAVEPVAHTGDQEAADLVDGVCCGLPSHDPGLQYFHHFTHTTRNAQKPGLKAGAVLAAGS